MAVTHGLRWMSLGIAIFGGIALSSQCWGQLPNSNDPATVPEPQGTFLNRVLTDDQGDHKYVVFVPAMYSADTSWPVILFLHGASNRGTDGRSQLVSGLAPAIRLRPNDFPFLVVFPQCENTKGAFHSGWIDPPEDADRALKMLDAAESEFRIDKHRELLMGVSMGGGGVWEIAARTPKRWAALVPVSAMGKPEHAASLARIPTWVFHAKSDPLVPTEIAREMVAANHKAGGHAFYSEAQKHGHDLSSVVFTQRALSEWLLDPTQEPKLDNLEWTEPRGYSSGLEQEVPFVPGAEISRAIRFRICKDVFNALSYSPPEKLTSMPLTGHVNGIHQTTKVGGVLPIDVALSGLHYQGHVETVRMIPMAPDRLILQVGLRNMVMTVSNSQLSGKLFISASAGPMNVVIGHRTPAWLNMAIRPRVENRQIRLDLVGMDFQIAPDNWYVTSPSGVSVRGMPFLNSKVSDDLVEGIYSRKNEIERQFLNRIPGMVQEFETKLNAAISSKTMTVGEKLGPSYRPRLRIYPEEILIDEDGLTLVSGIVMGTLGQPPKSFKLLQYPAKPGEPEPIKTGIEIAISDSLITAASELLIAGRINCINVMNFPGAEYHRLADPAFLQEVISDLKRFGPEMEANVDIRLNAPVRLQKPGHSEEPKLTAGTNQGKEFTVVMPSLLLSISARGHGETEWTAVGDLNVTIERDLTPLVQKTGFAGRSVKFDAKSPARISSTWQFAPGFSPVNGEIDRLRLMAQVLAAHESGAVLNCFKPGASGDIKLGAIPVRMETLDWNAPFLTMQIQLAKVLVTNDSNEPLTYEVRGPNTAWSQPRTLAPGEHDEYRVPYPLTWRRQRPTGTQFYTLPLGKEFSYRNDPEPGMVLVSHEDELHEEAVGPH